MKKYNLLFIISLLIIFSSCGGKRISYFQDVEKQLQNQKFTVNSVDKETAIKSKDELTIIISSSDPSATALFNLQFADGTTNRIGAVNSTLPSQMYLNANQRVIPYFVDEDGYIHLPVLGKTKVAGLTQDEARVHLESKLKEYVKDPIVNLWISNFKISVLGAVSRPGPVYFTNQNVTVLDAISNAGDISLFGLPDKIFVIRENNGKKDFYHLDITKSDVFSSPYFYLQQNDVVYVEPNSEYQKNAEISTSKQFTLSIVTSAISTVISTISIIIALNKN